MTQSVPDWEPYTQPIAPEGTPNVLYIVLDDVGYSAMAPFGGLIAIEQAVGSARAMVLVLDGNDNLDITSAEQLGKLAGSLGAMNVPLGLAHVHGPALEMAERSGAARQGRGGPRLPDHARRRGLGAVSSRCAGSGARLPPGGRNPDPPAPPDKR